MKFFSDIACLGFTHDITCQIWDTWNYLGYCKNTHIKIIEAESGLFLEKLIFGKFKSETNHWVNTDDWHKQLDYKSRCGLLTGNSKATHTI